MSISTVSGAVWPDREQWPRRPLPAAVFACSTTRPNGPGHPPSRPAGIPRRISRQTTSSPGRTASPSGPTGNHRSSAGVRVILYLTLASVTGPAEVVARLDRGRHLLTEHHRRGRRVDLHLELRLLVLFDPERTAAVFGSEDLINARASASEGSSNEPSNPPNASAMNSLVKTLSPLGFANLDGKRLPANSDFSSWSYRDRATQNLNRTGEPGR